MSRYTIAIGLAIEGAALVFALSLCRAARRADQQRAGHHAELQVRAEPLAVASQHALGCPRTGLDVGADRVYSYPPHPPVVSDTNDPVPVRPRRPHHRNEVPARCLRCGLATRMPVRHLVHRAGYSRRLTVWQVHCPHCGAWVPGYPLSTPH